MYKIRASNWADQSYDWGGVMLSSLSHLHFFSNPRWYEWDREKEKEKKKKEDPPPGVGHVKRISISTPPHVTRGNRRPRKWQRCSKAERLRGLIKMLAVLSVNQTPSTKRSSNSTNSLVVWYLTWKWRTLECQRWFSVNCNAELLLQYSGIGSSVVSFRPSRNCLLVRIGKWYSQ